MKTCIPLFALVLFALVASASASDYVVDDPTVIPNIHGWGEAAMAPTLGVVIQYAPQLFSVEPDETSPTPTMLLEWEIGENRSDTAFRYDIYRCTSNEYSSLAPEDSNWHYLDCVDASDPWEYADTTVEEATQYYYLVVSVIWFYDDIQSYVHYLAYETSTNSNYASPQAPTDLVVSYPNNTLRLDFDNDGNIQNHELYVVDITADTATPVDLGSATYYVHSTRNSAHSYAYAVRTKHNITNDPDGPGLPETSVSQTHCSLFSNTVYSDSPLDMDATVLFPYINENEFATSITMSKPGDCPTALNNEILAVQDFSDDFVTIIPSAFFTGDEYIIIPIPTLKDGCFYTFIVKLYDQYIGGNLTGISNEDTVVTPLFKPTNFTSSRNGSTVHLAWDYSGYRYNQSGFEFQWFWVDDLNNSGMFVITNGDKEADFVGTSGRTYNFAVRAHYLYTYPDDTTDDMYSDFSNVITGVSIP